MFRLNYSKAYIYECFYIDMVNIALLVVYALSLFNLLYSAHMHGKDRGKWSFWTISISTVLSLVLYWWVAGWSFI